MTEARNNTMQMRLLRARQARLRAESARFRAQLAEGKSPSAKGNSENLTMIRDLLVAQQRAAKPIEQAKTFLRHRGFVPVYSDGYARHIGRRHFTNDADLMAFANERGFEG